jgi:hypothetical protein
MGTLAREAYMPSLKIHCFWDRQLFGRSFWRLHKALDKPYLVLGLKHRIIFHDGWSATEVAKKIYPNDPVACEAAVAHVLLDEQCSHDKRFHEFMKEMYKIDAKNRRQRILGCGQGNRKKKKEPATSASLKEKEKTFKKLLEIRRFANLKILAR